MHLLSIEILVLLGIMLKRQKRHVEALCNLYAAPHTHPQQTNIPQHRLCGEKPQCHIKSDIESNADTKMQLGSQAVLWQLKILHIPKRKTTTNSNETKLIKKELK